MIHILIFVLAAAVAGILFSLVCGEIAYRMGYERHYGHEVAASGGLRLIIGPQPQKRSAAVS